MKIVSVVKFVTILDALCPGSAGGAGPGEHHTRGTGFTLAIQVMELGFLADWELAVLTRWPGRFSRNSIIAMEANSHAGSSVMAGLGGWVLRGEPAGRNGHRATGIEQRSSLG